MGSSLEEFLRVCSRVLGYTGGALFLIGGKLLRIITPVDFWTAEAYCVSTGLILMFVAAGLSPPEFLRRMRKSRSGDQTAREEALAVGWKQRANTKARRDSAKKGLGKPLRSSHGYRRLRK